MHENLSPEEIAVIWNAVLSVYIDDRSPVERVCGYDPRFLLTDGRLTSLWDARVLVDAYREKYPELLAMWNGLDSQNETIDFDPLYRDEMVLFVDSEGTVLEVKTFRVPIKRGLTPFVAPIGPRDPDTLLAYTEESGEPIDPRYAGTVTGRWSGARISYPHLQKPDYGIPDKLDRVTFVTDFKTIEDRVMQVLGSKRERHEAMMLGTMMHESIRDSQMEMYRQAYFNVEPGPFDHMFDHLRRQPPKPEVKQNGRSAAYLRHDKSKSHKRRKRK